MTEYFHGDRRTRPAALRVDARRTLGERKGLRESKVERILFPYDRAAFRGAGRGVNAADEKGR